MKKLITSTILMAIGFLVMVVVYGKVKSIIFSTPGPANIEYSTNQMIYGGLGESIRALLTSWLYTRHRTNKSRWTNALKFGMVCAALIGSIWLFVGMELVDPDYKLSFILDDGLILFFQGLISGFVLWLIYKDEK